MPKLAVYSSSTVPSNFCGRYAVNASKKHYDNEFTRGNAWDMRYDNKIIEKLEKNPYRALDSLRMIGELSPGMILGVYNPGSGQNGKKDKKGIERKYTHVMMFAGKNKEGKLMYDHKWGGKTLRVDHEWMKARNIAPKEVFGVKNDPAHTNLKRKKIILNLLESKKAYSVQKS